MEKHNDIISRIKTSYTSLSKGHRKIANYILEHYDKAAFMTAARLSEVVGISESTVVRFATELGFEGYTYFQKELQKIIRNKLTAVQRMEVASDQIGEQDVLDTVMNSDLDKIKQTLEELDKKVFAQSVETIINANKIYILGVRSSSALASFLGFYFNLLFDNVRLVHTTSASEMFEQILRTGPGDVVIGISFPRYSQRTVKALQYAKKCGSKVIAITDNISSPITEYADSSLIAKSDMASFVDSLVAPLSLINALIVAIAMLKKDEVFNAFNNLEHIWEEYNVYEKYEEEEV